MCQTSSIKQKKFNCKINQVFSVFYIIILVISACNNTPSIENEVQLCNAIIPVKCDRTFECYSPEILEQEGAPFHSYSECVSYYTAVFDCGPSWLCKDDDDQTLRIFSPEGAQKCIEAFHSLECGRKRPQVCDEVCVEGS